MFCFVTFITGCDGSTGVIRELVCSSSCNVSQCVVQRQCNNYSLLVKAKLDKECSQMMLIPLPLVTWKDSTQSAGMYMLNVITVFSLLNESTQTLFFV